MSPANDFFDKLHGTWANRLNGDWLDALGWNFISQPRAGGPEHDDFVMRRDQMRETITFKKLGIARNVGVDGRAGFWDGMAYTIEIQNLAGDDIHHEMGHFLLNVGEDGETAQPLRAPVLRQASIPRANAMLTPGSLVIGDVANAPDVYDARPRSEDTVEQAAIDVQFAEQQRAVSAAGGPDLRRPLQWLARQFPVPKPGTTDWEFDFHKNTEQDSMASGQRVRNPVGIGPLLSAFWIGERLQDGQTLEVLQYAQVVDIKFNGIDWPHTAVNTLFKQSATTPPMPQ